MKKFIAIIKGCPLFVSLILTAILISAVAYAGAAMGIYKLDVSWAHPMLESVLLDEREATATDASQTARATQIDATEKSNDKIDGKSKSDSMSNSDDGNKTDRESKADSAGKDSAEDENTTEKTAEKTDSKMTIDSGGSEAPIKRPTKYKQIETRKSRNSCYEDLTQIALETDYPYVKVDKAYFDDALFIGDSRVEGLSLYSGLDNAEFACMEGLTTFGLMTEKVAANGTETLTELLSSNTYSKIYIMLGINEAGYNTDSYADAYMDAIAQIQELQPNAVIFMMACMHVSSEYSDSHNVINNDNIDQKNGAIAAYADGVKLFYLDVNTVLDDENGGLIKDYTWDDIHLQAQYYSVWEEYLYERGLDDGMFAK